MSGEDAFLPFHSSTVCSLSSSCLSVIAGGGWKKKEFFFFFNYTMEFPGNNFNYLVQYKN